MESGDAGLWRVRWLQKAHKAQGTGHKLAGTHVVQSVGRVPEEQRHDKKVGAECP